MNSTEIRWTITELARGFGLDRRTVMKRLENVDPVGVDGRSKLYRLADAARAFYAPVTGPGADGPLDAHHQSARLQKAKADKTELEVEVLKGSLIQSDTVAQVWGDQIASARAKLVALPSTAAPRIQGLNITETENELRDLVHQALDELQDYEPGHYAARGSAQADPGSVPDVEAPADVKRKRVGGRKAGTVKRGKRRARKVED